MPETQAEEYARLLPQLRRAVAKTHSVTMPPKWDHTFHFPDFTAIIQRFAAVPEGDRLFVSVSVPIMRGGPSPTRAAVTALKAVREFLGPVGEPVDETAPGDAYVTWIFDPPAEWYSNPGPKREEV
jgi:hypothetical protein